MLQKCKIQNKRQGQLGVTAVLLVTYIYIERGELGYSVNGINNKGVYMTGIQDLYQTIHNIISVSQGMNQVHLTNLSSFKGCLFASL